jgi:hypothetical protein
MAAMAENLTERQAKYFASLRASLEAATGKTLAEWVAIARTCPETGYRARLKWFKDTHGLLQNRAGYVLGEAFDHEQGWDDPAALTAALWTDPGARAIYEAVGAAALRLEGTVPTARKAYSAWSRQFQYAALRPLKDGRAILGLGLAPGEGREAPSRPPWSERLKSQVTLAGPADVDARLEAFLRAAWESA